MKKFLINFKSIIQFLVSIIASREFAFIYCVFGTIAQTAHTYYLLDGISSLNGWWKITQSVLLSFFISSSLLYFTAISDTNDKSIAGKRVLNAVTLFMWLEMELNNNEKIDIENINIISNEIDKLNQRIDSLSSIDNFDLGTNPKEYISNLIDEMFNNNLNKINNSIELSFNKHSDLALKQFENKLKMTLQENQLNKH